MSRGETMKRAGTLGNRQQSIMRQTKTRGSLTGVDGRKDEAASL